MIKRRYLFLHYACVLQGRRFRIVLPILELYLVHEGEGSQMDGVNPNASQLAAIAEYLSCYELAAGALM